MYFVSGGKHLLGFVWSREMVDLEEDEVQEEVDEDGDGLDHRQQQPGSEQLVAVRAEEWALNCSAKNVL